jgi:AcrR family transcriptional regulator
MSRPEPAPLTLDAIVAAAVGLIDVDGVAGLTMRQLAARLGCSPMALYRHVQTKQDLLRLIAQHYLAGVELPNTEGLPWSEAIVAVAAAIHHAVLAHSALVEIVGLQHVDALAVFRASEIILRALRSAGLSGRDAVRSLSVITAYAVGATQRKAELRSGADVEARRLRQLLELPADAFPVVRELTGELVTVDHDLSFEDGLRLLLGGLAPR